MQIAGRVAVVSGGASGIGRATVRALAERGANVVVADIDAAGAEQTVEMAKGLAGAVAFRRCDVTKSEDLEALFDWAVQRFDRLGIAFNNAGIGGEARRRPSGRTQPTCWAARHDPARCSPSRRPFQASLR